MIRSTDTEVLSLVGVLEHLMDPLGALQAFTESNASYLYLQVPLFSFAAIQESMHNDVFPRQLNAGHTHLYTKESLDFLCKKFSLEKAGEWWFGTDMVDLFRHLHIKVQGQSQQKSDIIQNYFGDSIDELQKAIDKEKIQRLSTFVTTRTGYKEMTSSGRAPEGAAKRNADEFIAEMQLLNLIDYYKKD